MKPLLQVALLLRRGGNPRSSDATTGTLPHLAAAGSGRRQGEAGDKAETVGPRLCISTSLLKSV